MTEQFNCVLLQLAARVNKRRGEIARDSRWRFVAVKLTARRNATETKQFQNSFETVLKLFCSVLASGVIIYLFRHKTSK